MGANLSEANLEGADLSGANLQEANLDMAELQGADLRYSFLKNAKFQDASLEKSDLRGAMDLILDNTCMRQAQFDNRAADAWFVLRRTYSGPRLMFNLLFLITFLVPYVFKTLFWSSVNRAQIISEAAMSEPVGARGLDIEILANYALCLAEQCDEMRVWELVLGVDKGWTFWTLAIALITYNGLKALLTWRIAPMRDEEERSGYSPYWNTDRMRNFPPHLANHFPSWLPEQFWNWIPDDFWKWVWKRTLWMRGYRILYWVHQYFVRWVFWLALTAFVYNTLDWFSRPVWIPS